MKEYIVDRNRRIMIYDLHEALVAAGSSDTDHVFEQDQKLESFFTGCRVQRLLWDPATYDRDLEQAISDSVEVLIITRK
jgi:hypothetical protein